MSTTAPIASARHINRFVDTSVKFQREAQGNSVKKSFICMMSPEYAPRGHAVHHGGIDACITMDSTSFITMEEATAHASHSGCGSAWLREARQVVCGQCGQCGWRAGSVTAAHGSTASSCEQPTCRVRACSASHHAGQNSIAIRRAAKPGPGGRLNERGPDVRLFPHDALRPCVRQAQGGDLRQPGRNSTRPAVSVLRR